MKAFQKYDFNLAAGAASERTVQGSYLRILSATGSVEVSFDGGAAVPLNAGQAVRLVAGEQFQKFTVRDTSGALNTILAFIGDAAFENDSVTGTVSLAGTPTVIASPQSFNFGKPNYTYRDGGATIAGVVTVMTPAQNPNGAIVINAAILGGGGGNQSAFVAHTANPLVWTTGDIILGAFASFEHQPSPIYVPAGNGVYYASAGVVAFCMRWINIRTL